MPFVPSVGNSAVRNDKFLASYTDGQLQWWMAAGCCFMFLVGKRHFTAGLRQGVGNTKEFTKMSIKFRTKLDSLRVIVHKMHRSSSFAYEVIRVFDRIRHCRNIYFRFNF